MGEKLLTILLFAVMVSFFVSAAQLEPRTEREQILRNNSRISELEKEMQEVRLWQVNRTNYDDNLDRTNADRITKMQVTVEAHEKLLWVLIGALVVVGVGSTWGLIMKVSRIQRTANAIHSLSNSAMGSQLAESIADKEALSVVLHGVAAATGHPSAQAAAKAIDVRVEEARRIYQDHLNKQEKADIREEKRYQQ